MSLTFEFKVDEVFQIGNKTVFAGSLNSTEKLIENTECRVVVDGETVGTLFIEGEVLGTGHRDLWTTHSTNLSRETAKNHSVALVSP
jgi:hypothetical protein